MPTIAVASCKTLFIRTLPWLEHRYYSFVARGPVVDGDRHPDRNLGRIDVNQVRHHPHPFLQIDERRHDRIVKCRVLRMMQKCVAVDHALAGKICYLEVERVTVRT